MVEKAPSQETNPQRRESILSQEFVEMVLATAKENLKKDGSLAPVLFLRFRGGAHAIAQLLSLPSTTEEKEAYFATLGRGLQQAGHVLDEAVFVSESWYVAAEKGERLKLDVAPSQHPKRKEAITIVGRNAARTHFTMVVQTFGRDRRNQPVFGPLDIAEYNVSADKGPYPTGLLDHLFPRRIRGFPMN
jgi:hypothetical protein